MIVKCKTCGLTLYQDNQDGGLFWEPDCEDCHDYRTQGLAMALSEATGPDTTWDQAYHYARG